MALIADCWISRAISSFSFVGSLRYQFLYREDIKDKQRQLESDMANMHWTRIHFCTAIILLAAAICTGSLYSVLAQVDSELRRHEERIDSECPFMKHPYEKHFFRIDVTPEPGLRGDIIGLLRLLREGPEGLSQNPEIHISL